MAIADKFIMNQETANGLVYGIKVGGIFGRVGIYFLFYIPISLLFILAVSIDSSPRHIPFTGNEGFNIFLALAIPMLFVTLIEFAVRSWRKKNGFSINANIAEELKQRKVNTYVAREMKARSNESSLHTPKDLDYWFGMFQKNAITKEQYELKRAELLKS